jgi:nucleoside-diphosphate-sugar epimerase
MSDAIDQLRGRRVLVTGGAGFIGSHLVDHLLAVGAHVRVLDNFATGHRRNLSNLSAIELSEGDIRDQAACAKACDGVSAVFHQAALGSVPHSVEDPANAIAINVAGTANVFAAARDAGVHRVVYASSSAVYGDDPSRLKREGQEGALLSPYAVSKWMNEELADVYARCYDMSFVGLRYFNVYGARQDPNGPYAAVIPKFFAAVTAGAAPVIFGTGEQLRDFVHVSDVARANMLAAVANTRGAIALNIGAESATTINELATTIITVMGANLAPTYTDPRPGDILVSSADASRARAAIGWQAEVSLAAGLAMTKPA